MWKDLKDKMKRLFEQEENHAEEAAVHKEEKKDVNAKTKMTYRYPKQGEFRFPVIPDQDQERREHVSRARSERRRHVQEEEPEVEKRPQRRKRKQPEPEEELKETLETTSIPFTPTDVPSPIFGYQTRQMTKGLQNLEYTVEENSKPEFYTGSYEEKKWQDLREKLRERVQVGRKQPDAVPPSEEEPEQESHQEGAASLEMEAPVQEELPNRNEELSKLKDTSIRGEHTEETPADTDPPGHEDTSTVDFEMHASHPETEVSSMEAGPDQEVNAEAHEEETYRYRLQDIFDQDAPAIGNTNDDGNGEVHTEEEQSEEPENEETQVGPFEDDSSEAAERPFVNEEEEEEAVPEGAGELPDPEEYMAGEVEAELKVETETERTEVNQPEFEEPEGHTAEDEAGDGTEATEELPDAGPEHEAASVLDEQERKTKEDMEPQPLGEEPADSREDQEETPKSSSRRSVPFNVLMTPRDKRSRDHQKPEAPKKEEPKPEAVQTKDTHVEKPAAEQEEAAGKRRTEYVRSEYQTPLHLLEDPVRPSTDDDSWITGQMELLETTLRHFHVRANVVNAMKGPSVTRFEVQPEPGVKVSKITNLADDIKLSMAAKDIRIEAPIPGKQAVGIEVPNKQPQMVGLQEIFEDEAFSQEQSPLSVGLGLDIGGESIVTNLKKMPHGLIAGATGSGKSVCINTILVSLLYKAHYDDVKFLLIDPKMVELAPYNDLPHLVAPVITDVKAATTALKWAVKEMEERYEKFVAEGVRDVERYNDKMIKQGRASEKLPYLVIVIDELADLMMVSPQDVEDAICRIAQKARACGIHLLLATQRPSVDVITGLIKANIPTRIAFSVSSQVDSRTIIDSSGAEKLLGKGDMLFVENGSGQPVRIQGAFVSDDEIERVTSFIKKMAPPQYLFHQDELIKQVSTEEETDELFDEAVDFVLAQNGASASLIQRRFKVGYNRAARLIDQMEDYGIISEQKGSKPRDVLLTRQQIEEIMD
ncbi:DNA translocase FtsK [Halobacillus kuroshimensis]|uniref:DNA translocase FtsK n=1 Tax=Halobacillus kuroshimensis TaxID=302481 RepID=A0ABS3E040_9BACI|nr:DNA translocase FtsK [Halobacillus kuroshimensis]MBN8236968.1 DNA translocase FtsK [Halobacillus kuroshimensis]